MISTAALKPGSIGIGVNKQQAYLNMMQEKGFINTRNLQDGVYGTRTEQAVREWQRYANLPIDGEIGFVIYRLSPIFLSQAALTTSALVRREFPSLKCRNI